MFVATARELLNEAKSAIREAQADEVQPLLDEDGVVCLDVREPDEYEQGAIPGGAAPPAGPARVLGRGQDPRQVRLRSSCTAPAGCGRPSRPRP